MLDYTPASLFTNLVLSAIGFGLFTYGKKSERWPQMIGGILLMAYPYFVSSTAQLITGGLAIGGGVIAAVALGY